MRAGCHARVHRTRILGHWLPEIPVAIWREWHPDAVEQLQLPVEMSAAVPREAGGKYSRIFVPDPAQYTFDWSREGELEGPPVG